ANPASSRAMGARKPAASAALFDGSSSSGSPHLENRAEILLRSDIWRRTRAGAPQRVHHVGGTDGYRILDRYSPLLADCLAASPGNGPAYRRGMGPRLRHQEGLH